MKAADITDEAFLAALDEMTDRMGGPLRYGRMIPRQFVGDVLRETTPDLPDKVVLAKARSMIKRKVIEGCGCGCRGDFCRPKPRPQEGT
jgi:hypothetical protein